MRVRQLSTAEVLQQEVQLLELLQIFSGMYTPDEWWCTKHGARFNDYRRCKCEKLVYVKKMPAYNVLDILLEEIEAGARRIETV